MADIVAGAPPGRVVLPMHRGEAGQPPVAAARPTVRPQWDKWDSEFRLPTTPGPPRDAGGGFNLYWLTDDPAPDDVRLRR